METAEHRRQKEQVRKQIQLAEKRLNIISKQEQVMKRATK